LLLKKGIKLGQKNKAEQNKIDLLIIREQNDSDWQDADGTPYVKTIHVDMHLNMPAVITRFEPVIDAEWIKLNTKIDVPKQLRLHGLDNELFIDDLDRNEKYSLYDLASQLSPIGHQEFGQFLKEEDFKNAFLYHRDLKLKINAYKIEYSISKPLIESMEIDFSKELIGVVEYLQKGTKKSIFRDGIIKDNDL